MRIPIFRHWLPAFLLAMTALEETSSKLAKQRLLPRHPGYQRDEPLSDQ
ncbi:hypothetical protein P3W85_34205 [Cupriavidus basilensis]|uniref:Uncharacterized protein n=1 Tax=Cupriavidus basilensis TaxID=68895 RepID=A0ABT6AZ99_9BURK|nr:hypothetical protein [Cupriavidus basilensis]MDF3837949.1 hypothetical protein [Cupriavidus basilensis]